MKKHIMPVLMSFLGVLLVLSLGANIAYQFKVIPYLKNDFDDQKAEIIQEKETSIKLIQEEFEQRAKEEEDRILIEKKSTDFETQQAAEAARAAAEAAASKKSHAS